MSICIPIIDTVICFLDSLIGVTDYFSSSLENFIVMIVWYSVTWLWYGGIIKVNDLINLIKENTCFKVQRSWMDLLLTNRRFSFKNSNSYETGISDHQLSIHLKLKFTFFNLQQQLVLCRDYKSFLLTTLEWVHIMP